MLAILAGGPLLEQWRRRHDDTIGQIIVAVVNHARIAELLESDRVHSGS